MYVIYRRAQEQMPAEEKEIEQAKSEEINFLFQNNIVRIIGEKEVEQIELIKTELINKEGETRKVPVNILGSNYMIDIDYIVMALGGQIADETKELGLNLNDFGKVLINDNYETSENRVYAGGDLVNRNRTVAYAAFSGKEAAKKILNILQNKKI